MLFPFLTFYSAAGQRNFYNFQSGIFIAISKEKTSFRLVA
jgi:hypothetical protein